MWLIATVAVQFICCLLDHIKKSGYFLKHHSFGQRIAYGHESNRTWTVVKLGWAQLCSSNRRFLPFQSTVEMKWIVEFEIFQLSLILWVRYCVFYFLELSLDRFDGWWCMLITLLCSLAENLAINRFYFDKFTLM